MKGPFKDSDINNELFEYGDERNPIRYCKMCASQLNLKMPPSSISLFHNNLNTDKLKQQNKKEKIVELINKTNLLDIEDNEMKTQNDIPQIINGNIGVYVVKCLDNTLFCGTTKDIEKSIKYMNEGSGNEYTRPKTRRPVKLVYINQVKDTKSANIKKAEFKRKFSI